MKAYEYQCGDMTVYIRAKNCIDAVKRLKKMVGENVKIRLRRVITLADLDAMGQIGR